jgi:hypothetical protein
MKLLLTFVLLYLYFFSFARDETITILAGPTINSTMIKDDAVSALPDQNSIFCFSQAFQIQSPKLIERFSFYYQSGKLYNHKSSVNPKSTKIAFDYYRIWYLLRKEKNFAGCGINLQTSNSTTNRSEFQNNPNYNCFLTAFSPAFRFERRMINKKQKSVVFSLTNTLSILGYIIRPSIGTVAPIDYSGKISQNTNDYFSSGRLVFFNKLQLITSSLAFDFHLSRRLIFSIGYNWNYMYYEVDPLYYQVNHQIFTYVGIKF